MLLNKKRLAAGSILAATLLLVPLSVGAQNYPDRVERSQKVERGTNAGQPGYWVQVDETTFRWFNSIADVERLYQEILGPNVKPSPADLQKIADRIDKGQLTPDALKKELQALKPHVTNINQMGIHPYDNVPNTPTHDYHVRSFQLQELEKTFGQTLKAQFNDSTDWEGRRAAILAEQNSPNNDNFYHNTKSILSQAYRFLEIAESMKTLGMTQMAFTQPLDGNFSQYAGTISYNVYNFNDPYLKKYAVNTGYTVWNGYSSYFDLNVPSLTYEDAMGLAKALFREAIWTASPIAFDLNGDGKIAVTGTSTAKMRNPKNKFVPKGAVNFDLLAQGSVLRTEWLDRGVDGFLVDDRDGKVSAAARSNGKIDGSFLFGNAGGYANGFTKMAMMFDTPAMMADNSGLVPKASDKMLRGDQLKGLKVWQDKNQDGLVQVAELSTLPALGITEVSMKYDYVLNKDGEYLMQSHVVRNGKKVLSEDVWFATERQ